MPKMITGKKTQQYSDEFRVKAVEWSHQAHRRVKSVAEALDIHPMKHIIADFGSLFRVSLVAQIFISTGRKLSISLLDTHFLTSCRALWLVPKPTLQYLIYLSSSLLLQGWL